MISTSNFKPWICLIVLLLSASCSQSENARNHVQSPASLDIHTYDSMNIPSFFIELVLNHRKAYVHQDRAMNYAQFCSRFGIDSSNESNLNTYVTIHLLHDIFTSKSAFNCSYGDVVKIPYQWHWVSPNPRHKLRFVKDGSLLTENKPPKDFAKYQSYADVDRTPQIYMTDLMSEEPKYFSSSCDTFYTFGWCSEREMSFVCLLKLLGVEGKVVASGNHSWSEFVPVFRDSNSKPVQIKVRVDNTFNHVTWEDLEGVNPVTWLQDYGEAKLHKWYNTKAHSETQADILSNFIVTPKVSSRIEKQVAVYIASRS